VGHGALFCLKVLEIRQSLEIGAQMGAVERPLKALPTETLCLVFASQRLHHIEVHLLPFERDPTGPVFIDGTRAANVYVRVQAPFTTRPQVGAGRITGSSADPVIRVIGNRVASDHWAVKGCARSSVLLF
jgi:hypothetical protein